MKQKRDKQGRYAKKQNTFIVLLVLAAIGLGYTMIYHPTLIERLMSKTISSEGQMTLPKVPQTSCDYLCEKQKSQRELVESTIKKLEIVREQQEVVNKIGDEYDREISSLKEKVEDYKLNLGALETYGSGTLGLFYESAQDAGLIGSSTIAYE